MNEGVFDIQFSYVQHEVAEEVYGALQDTYGVYGVCFAQVVIFYFPCQFFDSLL
jgi:hypothetical protein